METQNNVLVDVGTILKLPTKVMNVLVDKVNLCIGSTIYETKTAGEDVVIINIGIGTLSVNLVDMSCKFVPSKNLKTAIKRGLDSKIDPIELVLDSAVQDKLLAVCSEVLF